MNIEQLSQKARKQWNRRTIGVLALGVLLSGMPALAQQGEQNPPDQSGAPANTPQTQQDQSAQQQQQQQNDQAQQDQQAPPDQAAAPAQENQSPAPPQQSPRMRPANLP